MNMNAGGSKPTHDDIDEDDDFDDEEKTVVIDDDDDDFDTDDDDDSTVVLDDSGTFTDNVGDVSVEINVEELLADIEANNDKDAARRREIRKRLEEVAERRSLDDTYAIDFD